MNKKRLVKGKVIDENEYIQEIKDAGLGWLKAIDRIDSERGDFANAVHENFSQETLARICISHFKTLAIETLVNPELQPEFNRTIELGKKFVTYLIDNGLSELDRIRIETVGLPERQPPVIIFNRKNERPNRSMRRALR